MRGVDSDRDAVRPSRKQRAWLVVALVVVARVVLLSHTLRAAAENQWRDMCLSNLKCRQLAMLQYAADHDDHFPPTALWALDIIVYHGAPTVYLCPQDQRPVKPKSGELDTSYTMNASCGGLSVGGVGEPAALIVLFDGLTALGGVGDADFRHRKNRAPGANVTFADGHCSWLDREGFAKARVLP